MTDLVLGTSVDYDGSPAGVNAEQTAGGSVVVTLTGSIGNTGIKPILIVRSKAPGSSRPTKTYHQYGIGRQVIDLASGDLYYCQLKQVQADMDLDLTVVDS